MVTLSYDIWQAMVDGWVYKFAETSVFSIPGVDFNQYWDAQETPRNTALNILKKYREEK